MAGAGAAKYAAALATIPIAVPILFLALVADAASQPPPYCATAGTAAQAAVVDDELDSEQMAVAQQVVGAVRAFPPTADKPHAAVIALATARQESGIRNLDYGDRDSLGVFQQRPSQGWGAPAHVMGVTHATTTFLEHPVLVPGWETSRVTDVAADVQRPAKQYRGLYQQWVPLATRLTERLWSNVNLSLVDSMPGEKCDDIALVAAGGAVYPVPGEFRWTDSHNWGSTGSHWDSRHTGTDFSVPCGTPVLAATSGAVEIATGESWAGPWLVKVVTGPTSLATWYAHMQKLNVHDGQTVGAGKQLGNAGDRGDATGCHLHFEVHLHNGSIYGPDNTNPSQWLARTVSH